MENSMDTKSRFTETVNNIDTMLELANFYANDSDNFENIEQAKTLYRAIVNIYLETCNGGKSLCDTRATCIKAMTALGNLYYKEKNYSLATHWFTSIQHI